MRSRSATASRSAIRSRIGRTARIGVTVAGIALLAGCASTPGATTPTPTETSTLSGELTIYAAASLTAAFNDIAAEFESENPGVDILPIVYDGSSTLVTQLSEGAQADVFASADQKNMDKAADAGLITDSELFATNTLVIATPVGNPGGVTSLQDLSNPDLAVVLCAPEVPCGAASKTLLDNQGVTVTPASLEQNVTAVLTKVANNEADAGLVYATDVKDNADVESIVPEGADQVVNKYPIAVLSSAANPEAAAAFTAFVTGAKGQAILGSYGFGAP